MEIQAAVQAHTSLDKACSGFVYENVLPLLGRVPGAACSKAELNQRLNNWFSHLQKSNIIVFDFCADWLLLADAMHVLTDKNQPAYFGEALFLKRSSITHPVFARALNSTYTQDWPPHHALADARGLRAGYQAWHQFMTRIWRIK